MASKDGTSSADGLYDNRLIQNVNKKNINNCLTKILLIFYKPNQIFDNAKSTGGIDENMELEYWSVGVLDVIQTEAYKSCF